jgi:hypothetical protein
MNLKKLFVLMFICHYYLLSAQINEKFEESLLSGIWGGNKTSFVVTPDSKLQLKAPPESSRSYLSSPSKAIINAEWQIGLQMNFNPSGSNYTRYYLCSDNPELTGPLNGYFLQIGNADDQLLLYKQTGTTLKKLGESGIKRLDMDTVKVEIKVLKDHAGNWNVFSRTAEGMDFTYEFSCNDATIEESSYAGIACYFTTTRREHFLFDYVFAAGETVIRPELPEKWKGDNTCFIVSQDNRIQLKAPKDKENAYLSTPSEVIRNAEWELSVQMDFNPSASNYLRYYLCSDNPVLSDSLNGYYLQLGNGNDQILFYKQTGMTMKKLGESESKRLDSDTVKIDVKVKKDEDGNWEIWSKKENEPTSLLEFQCNDDTWKRSGYAGVYCRFSSTRNQHFLFDSFSATGDIYIDETAPEILFTTTSANSLTLRFSEPVDPNHFFYHFNERINCQTNWKTNHSEVSFRFDNPLQSGTRYILYLDQFQDKAGNITYGQPVIFGLAELVSPGDVILNEVLFHPFSNGKEYVEIYNKSNKIINLSQLSLATRRTDLSIYSAKPLPSKLFFPGEYLVITADKDAVCYFYDCPDEESFIVLEKLPVYGNSKGCVVLIDPNNEVIDEFNYTSSMHNPLLAQTQGVSLERESFENNTWQSASADSKSGTPGYKNSQFIESGNPSSLIYLENEIGQPYEGPDKFLSIVYKLETSGYIANIAVYNVNGKLINKLGENLSLATEGKIYWNGQDYNGNVVSIAPYIILFEAFHPDGNVIRKSMVGIISK